VKERSGCLQRKWKQKKPKLSYSDNASIIEKLAAINGIKEIGRFINPTRDELHDPYLFKNIEEAANRIIKAVKTGENIAIHADIDADGVCSAAVMYRFLKKFTDNVTYFHAQRSRGHGIHQSISDIPDGTDLLIILDSSSNEEESCKKIFERGIDIVILDHHEIENKNEYCILVNPQQEGCQYPNKQASGVLVTFKVCQVIEDTLGGNYTDDLIDLVGLGLYSDQMSMLEYENRFILKHTLENINNKGIKAILKLLNKDISKLNANDFGYSVMPFVNAATRLDKIEYVLDLLISDEEDLIEQRVKEIRKLNEQRRQKQKEAIESIKEYINENDKCIVLVEPELGKGFNGLVAGDIANAYQRPTIVLGNALKEKDEYHGSFRSVGFFKFLDFVRELPHVIFAGGHQGAGGLGIKKSDLENFKAELNARLRDVDFENVIRFDLNISPHEITESFIKEVNVFNKVTGKNFSEAKFLIEDMYVLNKKIIGSGDTLKLELCPASMTWFDDIENIEPTLVGMKFKADQEAIDSVKAGDTIDLVGSLNVNEFTKWRPVREVIKTLQVFIEDFRQSI
jgi:single-stranded-DNA-specific exonuclease